VHGRRSTTLPAAAQPLLIERPQPRVVLRVAVMMLLLLAPWPGVGRLFAAGFALYANAVVQSLRLESAGARPPVSLPTDVQRREPAVDDWTVMLSADLAGSDGSVMPLGVRILGYTPVAIFVALVLGIPMAWRRRLAIGALGTFILSARLAAAIAIPVARAFGRLGAQTTAGVAAEAAWDSLIDQPALSYVTPLVAWSVSFLATKPGKFSPMTGNRKRRRKIG
jgi:hypothetical protein